LDKIIDHSQYFGYTQDRAAYFKIFKKVWEYINEFPKTISDNKYVKTENVKEILTNAGFEPISVPGRLYHSVIEEYPKGQRCILKHDLNYLNAQTLVNPKGELIYITNKSNVDEKIGLTPEMIKLTGFSLEKAAADTIRPHVDKFYEISGDNNAMGNELLPKLYGGIHCMGAEVPQ
jgi:hypothetical protein